MLVSLLMTLRSIVPLHHQLTMIFFRATVLEWCEVWLSFLSYSKCHQNSIGSSQAYSFRQCYLSNNDDDSAHPITIVSSERDLGITFDKDLKFTDHLNLVVQKANSVLGIIKLTFTCRDANTIRLLYITLIRPILDYCYHSLESPPLKEYS